MSTVCKKMAFAFILDGVSTFRWKILGLEESSLFFIRIIAQCLRSYRNDTNSVVFSTDRVRDLWLNILQWLNVYLFLFSLFLPLNS